MARVRSDLDRHHLVELHRSGVPRHELCRQFGISRPTATRVLLEEGIALRGIEPLGADALSSYDKGESVLALSIRLGISRSSTINRLLASGRMVRDTSHNGRNPRAARCRAALTNEISRVHASSGEEAVGALLREAGFIVQAQRAVGPYNLDFAILPVAVEVLGSDWQRQANKVVTYRERVEALFDEGWNVLSIWLPARSRLGPGMVHEARTFIERSRTDPSFIRQHRVIGGNGKEPAAARLYLDHRP